MISSKIDEFNLIWLPDKSILDSIILDDWPDLASAILEKFIELGKIDTVFTLVKSEKGLNGYDEVYTSDVGFLALAYHTAWIKQGVYLSISARNLADILKSQNIEVFELIQMLMSVTDYFGGETRISKIDVAIDFIDESQSVDDISNHISDDWVVTDYTGRKSKARIDRHSMTVGNRTKVDTVYVGSKKGKTNNFLRIYNKKQEQEDNNGIYYDVAKKATDWVRFESSLRHDYAHQIGAMILNVSSVAEESSLLFKIFTDRYRFADANSKSSSRVWVDLTNSMIDLADDSINPLRLEYGEPADLDKQYEYLMTNSGLMSFMYRIEQRLGSDAVEEFLNSVYSNYEKFPVPEYVVNDTLKQVNRDKVLGVSPKKPWIDFQYKHDMIYDSDE
ncbi:replication initiation factor domain-containing protein [Leuconostoc citreum]